MHGRRRTTMLAGVLAIGTLFGCNTMTAPSDPSAETGVVRFQTFEGGFYSIESDDGRHFDPTNLPTQFQQQGLQVRFSGRIRTDIVSFHMYGEILDITDISVR